tara:strand:- start:1659 stop:1997 length:339 start_codon:yes stop_codon:yes gene_type:complete
MTFRAEIMRKRLAKCEEILRPPGSFAARLHGLSPEYRVIYDAWKAERAEYWSEWNIDDIYRLIIGDICPLKPEPVLPPYIHNLLFPQPDPNLSPGEQYDQLLESVNAASYRS